MKIVDVVIIGSGPAGLQSAIHSVTRCSTMVFGKLEESNLWSAKVNNYLASVYPVLGKDLLLKSKKKAEELGVDFSAEDVVGISREETEFEVKSESSQVMTKSIILALGVTHKKLNVPGETEFLGRGVSYCADCDCMFFKNKVVLVVGDGSAAFRAADILSRFAKKVYLLYKEIKVVEDMKVNLEGLGVEFIKGEIKQIGGRDFVEWVELKGKGILNVDGVFIELGSRGIYEIAVELGIELDSQTMKYVKVDNYQRTNVPGVFAAGDITGYPFQLAKAVGQGCIAGVSACDFVKSKK